MNDINLKDIRAEDRVAVWATVIVTGSRGLAVALRPDHPAVSLNNLEIALHEKAIREDDRVTAPGFTPGEVGVVSFLLDAGGVVQPKGIGREACYACVVVDGSPPRVIRTDQLDRLETKKR
jgi:hypothetical protein